MGDVAPHFDRREFRCHGFGQRGHPSHGTPLEHKLMDRLENLRRICGGRPLKIVSGHRCVWWNRRVGGATRSRHLVCDAADIPKGYATVAQAEAAGFTGIGERDGWAVHVDVRPSPARWSY